MIYLIKHKRKLRIWNGFHKLNGDKVLVVGDLATLCDPFLAEELDILYLVVFIESIDQFLSGKADNLNNF